MHTVYQKSAHTHTHTRARARARAFSSERRHNLLISSFLVSLKARGPSI